MKEQEWEGTRVGFTSHINQKLFITICFRFALAVCGLKKMDMVSATIQTRKQAIANVKFTLVYLRSVQKVGVSRI